MNEIDRLRLENRILKERNDVLANENRAYNRRAINRLDIMLSEIDDMKLDHADIEASLDELKYKEDQLHENR